MPSDWSENKLSTLCEKIAVGLAISVTPYMRKKGTKLIRNQNIKRNFFNTKSVVYIDDDFADKNKSKKVYAGDVVAVRTGSNIGEACVVPKEFDGALTFTTLIARPILSKLSPEFLGLHINSERGLSEVNRLMAGGGKPNLNSGELKNYKLLTPPINEQRKIACILGTWDKAISTTECLIDNRKRQKKSLMQQLITGKKRLLDGSGKAFDGEWEEVRLSEVAQITMGSSPKSSAYNDIEDGLPLLQGNADIKKRKSFPRTYTSEITKQCHVGEILFSVRAPVGTVAISFHNACIGRGIAAIKAKVSHSQEFLYQWLLSFELKWERYSQGSTFEAVNSNDIKSLHLNIPNLDEQQKIALVLTNADKEIELLEQQLADLKQEKKALMQQLLTGKRRVKIKEKEVA
jgi:type I restriction enzyme S subunit